MSELYGNEEIQTKLQEEAEAVVFEMMTKIRARAYKLRHEMELPEDACVRTDFAGVKCIEFALAVFVEQYLKQENNGSWPVVTLQYVDQEEKGAV